MRMLFSISSTNYVYGRPDVWGDRVLLVVLHEEFQL